ncbi:hypothetical protein [Rhodococcus aetherivorans]|uniref:hypothetical protein n=2 Tax=Nocardiaceae TaxID=85025 RepID=UPI000678F19D|nr:hypothetical protein [Rhodococcus aetherivorans]UGQ40944.1 hypothetical protein LRQ66_22845 [Rhodococcus aetherivorans]
MGAESMDVTVVSVAELAAGLIPWIAEAIRMREHMNWCRVRPLCAGRILGAWSGSVWGAHLP